MSVLLSVETTGVEFLCVSGWQDPAFTVGKQTSSTSKTVKNIAHNCAGSSIFGQNEYFPVFVRVCLKTLSFSVLLSDHKAR